MKKAVDLSFFQKHPHALKHHGKNQPPSLIAPAWQALQTALNHQSHSPLCQPLDFSLKRMSKNKRYFTATADILTRHSMENTVNDDCSICVSQRSKCAQYPDPETGTSK